MEFRELSDKLRQAFSRFLYQTKVVQEMIAIARNVTAKFQTNLRVLHQAQRRGESIWQMSLVDVEWQTIETMEEFARMDCGPFLRNLSLLKTAETRFQQASCELIQGHLHLVAPIAGTYAKRGPRLAELIQEGIFGLIRAVERFGCRCELEFSTYAECWIRQSIRGALAS
jgi:DNA-directed RNA polymerase sigma subunit (sigma70/sigma32)